MPEARAHLKILYFAAVRDFVGLDEEELVLESRTTSLEELVRTLKEKHPRLSLEGVRIAVNEEFASGDIELRSGDVVALIPPVSGG